jgi:hypothetical protein
MGIAAECGKPEEAGRFFPLFVTLFFYKVRNYA